MRTLLILASLVSAAWLTAPAGAEELTGRQILDEVSTRHEAPYELEAQTMTLVDKKGNQEVREVKRYTRKETQGQFKYLVVFHGPPGVKGVALLTWQHQQADDDQWMYLPAYGDKVKRIAKGSKKNYFMGTDFTFEDLVSESRDKFAYERKPDETLNGVDCYVVDAIPSDPELIKETGYSKRTLWIKKETFIAVRTDYFDKPGKLLKRQTAADLVNIAGPMWRPTTTTMENFSTSHSTIVKVEHRAFEESAVPDDVFQERFLISGRHIR